MATEVRRVRRKRRHEYQTPVIRKRQVVIYAGALAIGFALGVLFLVYAPRAYSGWRESRLLKQATEKLQADDLEGAKLTAQQMLEVRPDSLAAFQILADATEKQNRADTVA